MGDIIEDVLTLAREGRAVDEPEWVAIESLAEVAWADVETEGATLSVPATGEMEADPTRARDLFANRFRNAVEHNDGPVTVTVGALEDGFYVADDGTVSAWPSSHR
jgi:signal transduction histidine kinase